MACYFYPLNLIFMLGTLSYNSMTQKTKCTYRTHWSIEKEPKIKRSHVSRFLTKVNNTWNWFTLVDMRYINHLIRGHKD